MEKGKIKKLLSIAIYSFLLLFSPLIADAYIVPWTSESYNAYATVYEWNDIGDLTFEDIVDNYSPPLPVSAYSHHDNGSGSYGTASSFMSDSNMQLQVAAHESTPGYFLNAYAGATFQGSYTAPTDSFQFSYSNGSAPLFYLYVVDDTEGTMLYDEYLTGNSGVITISTIKGNNITVISSLGLNVNDVPTNSVSIDYSMAVAPAVAPEPISSILFITGGTLLAGRSYLRKKKKV